MGLPEGLRRVGQTFTAKPKQPEPIPASEWLPSSRVDGVTVHEGDAAANYYADGLTPAMRAGFDAELALFEQQQQKQKQISFAEWQGQQSLDAYQRYLRGER